jgi:dihydrofolate reductase
VGKVIWHVTMSLDGFIAGPQDSMDWAFASASATGSSQVRPGPAGSVDADGAASEESVRKSTGAILAGRRWYDVATAKYDGVRGIYGGNWSGPVFVLTHRPPDPDSDATVTFLDDPLTEAVAIAMAAAGSAKNLEIFGADIARQTIGASLLDEIVVHIAPVMLGDGVRFYDVPDSPQVGLDRVAYEGGGATMDARFAVKRPTPER